MPAPLAPEFDGPTNHPTCDACRKQSDGAQRVLPIIPTGWNLSGYLCGTHYDEWRKAPEYAPLSTRRYLVFVERLRRERYAACWAV